MSTFTVYRMCPFIQISRLTLLSRRTASATEASIYFIQSLNDFHNYVLSLLIIFYILYGIDLYIIDSQKHVIKHVHKCSYLFNTLTVN